MHNLNVHHDINNSLFFAKVKGGMAHLSYKRLSARLIELYDTYVPVASRKMGVGTHLVESALEYAMERDISVQPVCPFVKKVMDNSEEYSSLKAS